MVSELILSQNTPDDLLNNIPFEVQWFLYIPLAVKFSNLAFWPLSVLCVLHNSSDKRLLFPRPLYRRFDAFCPDLLSMPE
jgi:hypothetical protein